MITPLLEPKPSISVSNWFNVFSALVVATHSGCFGTGTPYSVNLVDEHDTRPFPLLGGTNRGHGKLPRRQTFPQKSEPAKEERYVGFSGHGLCKQGLSGSRGHQQGALGYLTSQIGIFLGLFQELDNFFYLLLGFSKSHFLSLNVILMGTFFKQLGLGLSLDMRLIPLQTFLTF